MTTTDRRVLALIRDNPETTLLDLVAPDLPDGAVWRSVTALQAAGLVERRGRGWACVQEATSNERN